MSEEIVPVGNGEYKIEDPNDPPLISIGDFNHYICWEKCKSRLDFGCEGCHHLKRIEGGKVNSI